MLWWSKTETVRNLSAKLEREDKSFGPETFLLRASEWGLLTRVARADRALLVRIPQERLPQARGRGSQPPWDASPGGTNGRV